MPEYELTVERRERNPQYKVQAPMSYDHREPNERDEVLCVRTLTVVVNETEYQAIKRAVLETFD